MATERPGGARRALLAFALVALVPLVACGSGDGRDAEPTLDAQSYSARLKALEEKFDARVGVYALETGSGERIAYRSGERFPYASTHKALSAGAVLDEHPDGMGTLIRYSEDDLVDYSPVTEKHVDTGMTLRALCDAALRYSDNTAANLLFDELGGPEALDAVLERELGDDVTEVARVEPELNDWKPGDSRDTSTPRALAQDLREYVLGDTLSKRERKTLATWMRTNTTGDTLIRAGVPKGWTVGDKSGSGSTYGARNDIAVMWRPGKAPVVLAVLTNRRDKGAEADDKLVAEAASIVAGAID